MRLRKYFVLFTGLITASSGTINKQIRGNVKNDEMTTEDKEFWVRELSKSIPCPYELIVERGSGDGFYCPDEEILVNADDCPLGADFKGWEVVYGNPEIEDMFDSSTILTMPPNDVKIKAMCKCQEYELIVVDGTGDGDYCPGDEVKVKADECPLGSMFDGWDVVYGDPVEIEDPKSPSTTLIMPDNDVKIDPMCKCQEHELIVVDGTGDGDYCPGDEVKVKADRCPLESMFDGWDVVYGDPVEIEDPKSPSTTLIMPDNDVKIDPMCMKCTEYELIVVDGTGDGDYCPGEEVKVKADRCPLGSMFDGWDVVYGDPVEIEDPKSPSTTLIMPDNDVKIDPMCMKCTEHELIVVDGTGDGDYCPGEEIMVVADECPLGEMFDGWDVVYGAPVEIEDPKSSSTTLIMPDNDVKIDPMCKCQEHELIVVDGTGDGDYCPGEEVKVKADECPLGEMFDKWDVVYGDPVDIEDPTDPSTTLIMPDNNVKIDPMCKCQEHELIVVDGTGDGDYCPGERVPVEADECPLGEMFDKWDVVYGGPVEIVDRKDPSTIIIMPDNDVKIDPMCKCQEHELIVDKGDGDGDYCPGERVPVEADECPLGEEFDKWEVVYGDPDIRDPTDPTTIVTMPDNDARIRPMCKCQEHTLVVDRGDGDGEYCPDERVPVEADECPEGEVFEKWEVVYGNPTIRNPESEVTIVIMPDDDARIAAICEKEPFTLIVDRGSGDGDYFGDTRVPVEADECPEGEVFDGWEEVYGNPTIRRPDSDSTIVEMPFNNARIRATCVPRCDYTLIVDRGDGDGEYCAGDIVRLGADECDEDDEEFDRWEVIYGDPVIEDMDDPNSDLIMPDRDVRIIAICEPVPTPRPTRRPVTRQPAFRPPPPPTPRPTPRPTSPRPPPPTPRPTRRRPPPPTPRPTPRRPPPPTPRPTPRRPPPPTPRPTRRQPPPTPRPTPRQPPPTPRPTPRQPPPTPRPTRRQPPPTPRPSRDVIPPPPTPRPTQRPRGRPPTRRPTQRPQGGRPPTRRPTRRPVNTRRPTQRPQGRPPTRGPTRRPFQPFTRRPSQRRPPTRRPTRRPFQPVTRRPTQRPQGGRPPTRRPTRRPFQPVTRRPTQRPQGRPPTRRPTQRPQGGRPVSRRPTRRPFQPQPPRGPSPGRGRPSQWPSENPTPDRIRPTPGPTLPNTNTEED